MEMLTALQIVDWGLLDYRTALERQNSIVQDHLLGKGQDVLVLVEHPATVTLGRRATGADLRLSEPEFVERNVSLQQINRGGLATAHEPGQLVAYPIIRLKKKDLHWFSRTYLGVVISLLAEYGLRGDLKDSEPGVWVDGRKICSFGIALKKWVSSHGIALNVNNDLATFDTIIPCGRPEETVTSMSKELGFMLNYEELKNKFTSLFLRAFFYETM